MSKKVSNYGKKKEYPINKINAFKGKNVDSFRFTNHFFERWNERMPSHTFSTKEDMETHVKSIYKYNKVEHISGDYYVMDDLLFTAAEDNGGVVFITVYGLTGDNPVLMNLLLTQGSKAIRKAHRMYGKMTITPS
jgi:hypothetical protein